MTSSPYDPTLFEGAAKYYARYRPKYPKSVFDFLAARFKLDRTSRVLDLGCGTGDASLPLAPIVGEIVAMDPDPQMIAVGREVADAAGATNVRWLNAGSADLAQSLGMFCLVCMGKSFHWMERDQVLRDLYPMVEDDGGLAFLGPAHGFVLVGEGPEAPRGMWQDTADSVMKAYGVERTRHPRSNPSEPRHEAVILRSRFLIGEYHEFSDDLLLTPEYILGHLYSMSGNLRQRLGDRVDEFERDLKAALMQLWPSGQFTDRLGTGVLVAVKKSE